MLTRRLRFLILLAVALWLPIQGVAAIAMPFCRHGEANRTAAVAVEVVDHCHMHDRQPAAVDKDVNCDGCGFCHLATAGFMPSAERVAVVIPGARDFRADAPLAPASATPEPPQQPPKRLI